MGEPVGVYQEFGRPGLPLGGIYTKPADMPFPPFWLVYAKVTDIQASLAAVQAGAARSSWGQWRSRAETGSAQCLDPQGAAFALHQAKD